MQRIKIPNSKYFMLDELIPKEIYMKYYEKSLQFIDPRLITLIDYMRDYFKEPININTWWNAGDLNYSGFRPHDCPIGANESQHKFGRAADLHFGPNTDYEKIRNIVRNNYDKFKQAGLTTIEQDTKTWLHVDIRYTNQDRLYEVPIP